jgi:hypothetical protein
MPGWGTGSFENEDTQSFLGELKSLRIDDVRLLLARAADHEGYLEAKEAGIAIAAAEAIAGLSAAEESPRTSSLPGQILDWIGQNNLIGQNKAEAAAQLAELRELAQRAVERVRTNSELKDFWLQAEGLNEWSAALRDLEQRLSL